MSSSPPAARPPRRPAQRGGSTPGTAARGHAERSLAARADSRCGPTDLATTKRALRIAIGGTVQGVGFRPWVYRLAHEEAVAGSVRNDAEGVLIEAYGAPTALARFVERLGVEAPAAATIDRLRVEPGGEPADDVWPDAFAIAPSAPGSEQRYAIPPDLAPCAECLAEVFDPGDRRFRYPFTNCTNCGPRFTIALDLPYDRPVTTMAGFEMCPRCRAEYEDPLDRRFHAQPNACPRCGPRLALLSPRGERLASASEALLAVALAVRRGQIVAVKGLGGFHLVVSATDGSAVERLRRRKHRWEKPLAIMVRGLDEARRLCRVSEREAELLASPAAPIVLLPRRATTPFDAARLAAAVAPGNPRLGVMLPSTPLHHLLLAMVRGPVVATSGNLSDEPICIDDAEALERLGGIADLFLVHDRPIARHADDSVALVTRGQPRLLRRARGYAPRAIALPRPVPTLLAVGAHMKCAVAVARGDQAVLSQHIGDMETPQAIAAFEAVTADLLRMLEAEPVAVAHDLHPDYPSTLWARRFTAPGERPEAEPAAAGPGEASRRALRDLLRGLPTVAVQHHHAHLASCLADNSVEGRALGFTFDGTGYGPDGTVWGGEALLGGAAGFERVARLRPFRLPGGEAAVREPRRCALSLLTEVFGPEILEANDLPPLRGLDEASRRLLGRLTASGLGSPLSSSAGRLFDAVASLAGLHQTTSFEGQAAMALEFAVDTRETGAYPLPVVDAEDRPPGGERKPVARASAGRSAAPERSDRDPSAGGAAGHTDRAPLLEIDWRPLIEAVVGDVRSGVAPGIVAARFHNALAAAVATVARRVGEARVALTGGCFQNALLTERAARALEAGGFEVLLQRHVPANDGGIALGQIVVAAARLDRPSAPDATPPRSERS